MGLLRVGGGGGAYWCDAPIRRYRACRTKNRIQNQFTDVFLHIHIRLSSEWRSYHFLHLTSPPTISRLSVTWRCARRGWSKERRGRYVSPLVPDQRAAGWLWWSSSISYSCGSRVSALGSAAGPESRSNKSSGEEAQVRNVAGSHTQSRRYKICTRASPRSFDWGTDS